MTMEGDRLIEWAACNNADWCDAFGDLHGIAGAFGPCSWTSLAAASRVAGPG